jgi:hypothetical protein
MKTSEVRKGGLEILNTIYKVVLKSDDKELWKRAMDSMHKRIATLEARKHQQIMEDSEDANRTIVELWYWNSARRQFASKFGKKFISKK